MSHSDSGKAKNTWFWWLYILFVCALGYGRMIERLVKSSGGFWSQFGPPIATTVLVIGLVCWIYDKRILSQYVWRGVLALLALAQLTAFVFAIYLLGAGVYLPAGLMLLISIALVPAGAALYRYSWNSPHLWIRS